MGTSPLDSRWLPILLAVLVADVEFWYFASTGENDADYLGIVLFALFLAWWGRRLVARPTARGAVAVLGSIVALAMMVLRQTGTFDRGYIPPYAVFIAFTLLSGVFPS
jgi:hypothetical protein